jgi:hypothetical protein
MGTEIAGPVFGPLTLLGLVILLYLAISGRKAVVTESSLLGLGKSRIALGYLGIMIALAVCTYVDTVSLTDLKVQRGDVTRLYAQRAFVGWYLELYFLGVPLIVAAVTVFGLPLLAVLRRVRLASFLGTLLVGQLAAAVLTHVFGTPLLAHSLWAAAVTGGFALGARLPWLCSPAMRVNYRRSAP